MTLPKLAPIRLSRRLQPFDGADWLFELKPDGFRGLAFIDNGLCRLSFRATATGGKSKTSTDCGALTAQRNELLNG